MSQIYAHTPHISSIPFVAENRGLDTEIVCYGGGNQVGIWLQCAAEARGPRVTSAVMRHWKCFNHHFFEDWAHLLAVSLNTHVSLVSLQ